MIVFTRWHTVLLSVILLAAACKLTSENQPALLSSYQTVSPYLDITKIVDGDTFWVNDGTENGVKVRLIGIDAPETRKVKGKLPDPFGKQSTAYLKKLIGNQQVRLEFDVSRTDQYGRTLAYAYLPDGTFINADMVKNGYAMIMTVPPNVKYAIEFAKLQEAARMRRKGLWNK